MASKMMIVWDPLYAALVFYISYDKPTGQLMEFTKLNT